MTDTPPESTGGHELPPSDLQRPGAPLPGQPRWVREKRGRLICINWERWLSDNKPLDPYLVWADLSLFAGFGGWDEGSSARSDSGGHWPLLIELSRQALTVPLPPTAETTLDIFSLLNIPGLYKQPPADDGAVTLATRFITARITPDSIEQLQCHPAVLRFQLGLPRLPGTAADPPHRKGVHQRRVSRTVIGIIDDGCAFAHPAFCDPSGTTRVHFLWDQNADRTEHPLPWRYVQQAGYGGELWHEQLGQFSRLAACSSSDEVAYSGANYGPVHFDLERRSARFRLAGDVDVPVGTMMTASHGSSVMYLAAGVAHGAPDLRPLRQQRAIARTDSLTPMEPQGAKDFASRWPIVFVQLPTATTLDTSGGSLGVHVLDGVRYIIDRANCIPDDLRTDENSVAPDLGSRNRASELNRLYMNKIIINVSYGAVAGPHDGTSILEQAMADLVRDPTGMNDIGPVANLWLCLAAGNAHRSGTHARVSLAPGESKSLAWRVPPDNPLQSFLEIWLPESDADGHELEADFARHISVHVTPPGVPGRQVRFGQAWVCQLDDASIVKPRVVGAAVFARRVTQGLRGTMVLLAAAATRHDPDARQHGAPHGLWLVEVCNQSGSNEAGVQPGRSVVVHAWSERNDLVFGTRRSQQSQVESEDPIPEPTEFTPEARDYLASLAGPWPNHHLVDALEPRPSLGTLAGAATNRKRPVEFFKSSEYAYGQTVAVGGFRLGDDEAATYSSGGPQRHVIERSEGRAAPMPAATEAHYEATSSAPRNGPDVQAPSDVGNALRGLRTIGVRSGCVARLSGTSAASPSVARLIANAQHLNSWLRRAPDEQVGGADFGASPPEATWPAALRPTPTPSLDDKFRTGPWRVQ